jgi:hypothetical protein
MKSIYLVTVCTGFLTSMLLSLGAFADSPTVERATMAAKASATTDQCVAKSIVVSPDKSINITEVECRNGDSRVFAGEEELKSIRAIVNADKESE